MLAAASVCDGLHVYIMMMTHLYTTMRINVTEERVPHMGLSILLV